MLDRYWNKFDFRDTTWLTDTAAFEQTFANYLGAAEMVPAFPRGLFPGDLRCGLRRTLRCIVSREVAELYLYEPTPMRDEELNESVSPLSRSILRCWTRMRRFGLAISCGCSKNKVGSRAADIRYRTPSGLPETLWPYGSYVILFFQIRIAGCEVRGCVWTLLRPSETDRRGRLVVLYLCGRGRGVAQPCRAVMPLQGWIYGWTNGRRYVRRRATICVPILRLPAGTSSGGVGQNGVFPAIEQMRGVG